MRELVAADYVYSILRFYDPKVKSPNHYLVDGKIEGLDEVHREALRTNRLDYDRAYPGLQVLDRYTLRIRLTRPDPSFVHLMAINQFGAIAREVAERYGEDLGSHPVGTGPYVLAHWRRAHKIVLEANPGFRESTTSSSACRWSSSTRSRPTGGSPRGSRSAGCGWCARRCRAPAIPTST